MTRPYLSAVVVVAVALLAGLESDLFVDRIAAQRPMTNQDVLAMVNAKLSTELIVTTVENIRDAAFDTQAASIISLKRAGVNDAIVQAMVKAMSAGRNRGSATQSATLSYVDGYQMGWMYGDQTRRSGQRYNPDDIVLPGSMIHDMTIKLGAIEYEKWETGYLKGHEDGRKGSPRSPNPSAAPPGRVPPEMWFEPSSTTRAAVKSAQARHRGASVFAVAHDHGGMSQRHCEGFLVVLQDRLILEGTDATNGQEVHRFNVPYILVHEVKRNSLTIFFHVKLKDGRNFNLWTPDEEVANVVEKIVSIGQMPRK